MLEQEFVWFLFEVEYKNYKKRMENDDYNNSG